MEQGLTKESLIDEMVLCLYVELILKQARGWENKCVANARAEETERQNGSRRAK